MPAKQLDNISIEGLPILLTQDTTLKRFHPLIPILPAVIQSLQRQSITDKYIFLTVMDTDAELLSQQTGISVDMLRLLRSFFHNYDFINRRLTDITGIDKGLIDTLLNNNIKNSKDYLLLCKKGNGNMLQALLTDNTEALKLFCICDLMRLPGIKNIRAWLYYDCGYRSIDAVSDEETDSMRAKISDYINITNSIKSVPLRKELSTQIAVAKVIPKITSSLA